MHPWNVRFLLLVLASTLCIMVGAAFQAETSPWFTLALFVAAPCFVMAALTLRRPSGKTILDYVRGEADDDE